MNYTYCHFHVSKCQQQHLQQFIITWADVSDVVLNCFYDFCYNLVRTKEKTCSSCNHFSWKNPNELSVLMAISINMGNLIKQAINLSS